MTRKCCDDRLRQGRQTIKDLDAAQNPVLPHVVWRKGTPSLNIAPGAEKPSPGADDNRPEASRGFNFRDYRSQLLKHAYVQRIPFVRPIERNLGPCHTVQVASGI